MLECTKSLTADDDDDGINSSHIEILNNILYPMFTKYSSFRLRANTMSPYLPAHCPYAYYDCVCVYNIEDNAAFINNALPTQSRTTRLVCATVRACVRVMKKSWVFFFKHLLFYSKRSSKSIITSTTAAERC